MEQYPQYICEQTLSHLLKWPSNINEEINKIKNKLITFPLKEIARCLGHKNIIFRCAGIRALADLNNLDYMITLIRLLDDKSNKLIRLEVINALGKLKDNRAVEPLLNLLNYEPIEIRIATIIALANIGSSFVLPYFIEMLEDKDPRVRIATAEAFVLLGDKRSIIHLQGKALDSDENVRKVAKHCINMLRYGQESDPVEEKLKTNILNQQGKLQSQPGGDKQLENAAPDTAHVVSQDVDQQVLPHSEPDSATLQGPEQYPALTNEIREKDSLASIAEESTQVVDDEITELYKVEMTKRTSAKDTEEVEKHETPEEPEEPLKEGSDKMESITIAEESQLEDEDSAESKTIIEMEMVSSLVENLIDEFTQKPQETQPEVLSIQDQSYFDDLIVKPQEIELESKLKPKPEKEHIAEKKVLSREETTTIIEKFKIPDEIEGLTELVAHAVQETIEDITLKTEEVPETQVETPEQTEEAELLEVEDSATEETVREEIVEIEIVPEDTLPVEEFIEEQIAEPEEAVIAEIKEPAEEEQIAEPEEAVIAEIKEPTEEELVIEPEAAVKEEVAIAEIKEPTEEEQIAEPEAAITEEVAIAEEKEETDLPALKPKEETLKDKKDTKKERKTLKSIREEAKEKSISENDQIEGIPEQLTNQQEKDYIKLLGSKNLKDRKLAVKALHYSNTQEALDALVQSASTDISWVRKEAIKSIANNPNKEKVAHLISFLNDDKWYIKEEAARVLGVIKAKQAFTPLLALLDDENKWVQEAAIKSLASIDTASAMEHITKYTDSNHLNVRSAVQSTINSFNRKNNHK